MSKAVAGSVVTKMAGYETTFITRPEMNEDQLKALQDRIASVITEYKGELVLQEDWGTKRLAYKIQKETRGRYTYLVYTGEGNIVAEIERNLLINDFVMRFLSVNLAKEFEKDSFMKRREEIKAQAKKREEEREARREEREARRRSFDESGDDMGADAGE
ncbi:MAG: 30S ribosomal protein S6 [Cryobacterium sp.]|nr:30S ribosomal protein S6 [Oligoflexia bacterium]